MHLDLTPLLPQEAIHTIEDVVAEHANDKPVLLWPHWIDEVDVESTSVNILQASAQYLAAYGCLVSALIFGTYCSRYFVQHGNILSDTAALHYLRLGIAPIARQQNGVLEWLLANKIPSNYPGSHNAFFPHVCAVYVKHEFDNDPNKDSASIEFAADYLLDQC